MELNLNFVVDYWLIKEIVPSAEAIDIVELSRHNVLGHIFDLFLANESMDSSSLHHNSFQYQLDGLSLIIKEQVY